MVIILRKVSNVDWNYVLNLRNKFFKSFYKQNRPILQEEHYAYMEKQTSNSKFFQWIICNDNKDVGYVRILDFDVSIMIDDEFQGLGYSSAALKLVEKEAKKIGLEKLTALVKVDNPQSKHLFENNNFTLKSNHYEKKL